MSVYNYRKRDRVLSNKIDKEGLTPKDTMLIHEFVSALRLTGVSEPKIVNYIQFPYEILKIKKASNITKDISNWSNNYR